MNDNIGPEHVDADRERKNNERDIEDAITLPPSLVKCADTLSAEVKA